MKKRLIKLFLLMVLMVMLSACGGLRYSEVVPDAKDFHPKTIGVLPVNEGAYPEAKDMAGRIIADVLVKKGWFSRVVSAEEIKTRMGTDDDLEKVVKNYLTKLEKVSYSDPELSRKVGEINGIDALLVVSIDFWSYTTEKDDKVAKVGFGMDLVEAQSGTIIWTAGHHKVKKYKFFKPDLPKLAKSVSKKMISHMPH